MSIYCRSHRVLLLAVSGLELVGGFGSVAHGDTSATWNGSSNNWSSAADWSSNPNYPNNGVPIGALYDVVVGAGTINLDVSPTIQLLALSGGTIGGQNSLTVSGLFTWGGGQVGNSSASMILNANGGISLTGSNGSLYLKGEATINNSGVANWTGGFINALGNDIAGQNSTFNNLLGGSFNVQTDNTYYGYGSNQTAPDVFSNAGTFTKSLTTGTTSMDAEFNSSGQVNVQTGTLALAGGGSESGSFSVSSGAILNMSGAFTFSASSSVSGAGTAGFSSGTSTFNAGATLNPAGGVTITGGKVQLDSVQTLASLTISGASLDLTNTHLFIHYGANPDPVATIRGYLVSGDQNGSWGGSGIDSSAAAHNTAYALGYSDSADPGNPAQLASGTIEIKYTLYGDTNLDGEVNSVDFGTLAANFGKSGKVWDQGDFNYDGTVNSIDFGLLAGNFGKSVGSNADVASAADWAALDAFAAANGLMADVPEPITGTLAVLAGMGTLVRRRRR